MLQTSNSIKHQDIENVNLSRKGYAKQSLNTPFGTDQNPEYKTQVYNAICTDLC